MILFDEDSDARFYPVEAGTMITADLDLLIDRLVDTQVKTFVVGVNAQLTNYPSKVWQTYLDGFDMANGLEQPYMMALKDKWVYRRASGIQVLANHGIDSNSYLLRRAREKGMKGYVTIRMNDIHDSEYERHPLHSKFWMDHPEMRVSDHPYENGFDYTFEEVRTYYMGLIHEVLELYNIDGIVIDWMRGFPYFKEGEGYGKRDLITEMMTRICDSVRKAEKKSGRKIELCVRVPVKPQNALKLGFDALEWVKRELLDRLIISPYFYTNYEINANEWKSAINKSGFLVTADIENALSNYPGSLGTVMTVEEIRGAAWGALHRGADDIYLFNFMSRRNNPANRAMFTDCGSIETLHGKSRTFKITWDDVETPIRELDEMNRVPGYKEKWFAEKMANGIYPFPLPSTLAQGKTKIFKLYTGPTPESDAKWILKIDGLGTNSIVKINNHEFSFSHDICGIDRNTMQDESVIIEITNKGETDFTITNLELSVSFLEQRVE